MFSKPVALIALALMLAGTSGFATATAEGRQSLLSCKFGPDCTRENADCASYASWIILRYYEEEERFALFDTLQSTEDDALVREMGAMTIFEIEKVGDGETRFGSSLRMVVGPTLEAALQSVAVERTGEADLSFLPQAHGGMCTVIE